MQWIYFVHKFMATEKVIQTSVQNKSMKTKDNKVYFHSNLTTRMKSNSSFNEYTQKTNSTYKDTISYLSLFNNIIRIASRKTSTFKEIHHIIFPVDKQLKISNT